MDQSTISIRAATVDDIALILRFIHKKADFDRQVGAFSGDLAVKEDKLRDTLFNRCPLAHVLFVERAGLEFGFALYGFRYSSFAGQASLWLDDLYINAESRNQGAGALLMAQLADIASQQNCSHLGWTADVRNSSGLRFYERLGAIITGQQGNRCFLKWIPAA